MSNNNSDATPLKSLNLIISQYFSIDNSCKSVSNKNQRGEKWGARDMLACPDPLKQNKKQQLSDKRAFTLQQLSLSLSLVSRIYRPFHKQHVSLQTWEELNHTFHWNGLSEGRQHLLSSGPGGLSHHWPSPMITCAKMIMLFTHAHTQNR